MKYVDLSLQSEPLYEKTCAFAKEVYAEELGFRVSSFPETLFSIIDDEAVIGCIGLNLSLRSPLFVRDHRLSRIMCDGPELTYAEQNILALRHFSIGLPILISVAARYAQVQGIHRVAYAAIGVSQRTIKHLGFHTTEYGKVDLSLLPSQMRFQYVSWKQTFDPVCCFLETSNADAINDALFARFSSKIKLSPRLHTILCQLEQKAA